MHEDAFRIKLTAGLPVGECRKGHITKLEESLFLCSRLGYSDPSYMYTVYLLCPFDWQTRSIGPDRANDPLKWLSDHVCAFLHILLPPASLWFPLFRHCVLPSSSSNKRSSSRIDVSVMFVIKNNAAQEAAHETKEEGTPRAGMTRFNEFYDFGLWSEKNVAQQTMVSTLPTAPGTTVMWEWPSKEEGDVWGSESEMGRNCEKTERRSPLDALKAGKRTRQQVQTIKGQGEGINLLQELIAGEAIELSTMSQW